MSATFVGSLFLILTVAYLVLRGSSSIYPQSKRQVLRRRAWFREERARRAARVGGRPYPEIRTWHNPAFIISRVVELPVGASFEFENHPPLLQRSYTGSAILRMGMPDALEVVAEIMEPKPSNNNPILRVLVRGAAVSIASPGDSFWFSADAKLR